MTEEIETNEEPQVLDEAELADVDGGTFMYDFGRFVGRNLAAGAGGWDPTTQVYGA
jgi:hypothetical protein